MINKQDKKSFFSVNLDLILRERPLTYDLYINSSSHPTSERFVRVCKIDSILEDEDIHSLKERFHNLYVSENQRKDFLGSVAKSTRINEVEKTEIIKDSAIKYLSDVFEPGKEYNSEVLQEAIKGCQDTVEQFIDVVQNKDVKELQDLIANLSFHDFYTYDHSINVSMYCIALFNKIKPNATREQLNIAGLAGLLHDLGKLKIPTDIINKPDKLSDEEFAIIKAHPDYGKELIDANCDCLGSMNFDAVARVIHEHHENVNGTGYPRGLKSEEIHQLSKITAIADFFDAITTKRSYHKSMTTEEALALMANSVGKKIDENLFKIFKKHAGDLLVERTVNVEVPEDFDPCQPHRELPLEMKKAKSINSDFLKKEVVKEDFGKIKTDDTKKKKAS